MKPSRLSLTMLVLSLFAGIFFGFFPDTILRSLTTRDVPVSSDAIVLLAGSMKERAPTAAMLYRQGYAPRVLVSNDGVFSSWSPEYHRNLYQVEWAEEELVKLGVPRQAIIRLPFLGSGTIYESLAVKNEMKRAGLRKIIVVTSDYHTRRAGWTFRHTLEDYPSQVRTVPAQSFNLGRRVLFVEGVKLVYYRGRYGLLGLGPKER